jgi:hypothetical protein
MLGLNFWKWDVSPVYLAMLADRIRSLLVSGCKCEDYGKTYNECSAFSVS